MTVARSVADVLDDHVQFEVECIDRIYLNVWVLRVAYGGGVAGFFVGHRGHVYASTALMDPMAKAFVADIHGFVSARGLELVHFGKGQRKDDITAQVLAGFTDEEGVLYVGRAQEKSGGRTQRRHNRATVGSYAWLVRSTAFINFFYFYCVDADFGPFFIKFSSYFPFTARCASTATSGPNARPPRPGSGSPRWTTGSPPSMTWTDCRRFATVSARRTSTRCCAKWLRILPNPFTDDDQAAGYRYELSLLQTEFSLTQMLDTPVSERIFFEQVLHDNLDAGRPDRIGLVFDRRIVR